MSFGGLHPFPRRFGASRGRPLETVLESVLSSLGTAYDTSSTSLVWVKAMALARALWGAQEQNQRLANQFDPSRCTDFLQRWERVFGVAPTPGSTQTARRAELARRWRRIGRFPHIGGVTQTILEMLPNTFVELVHTAASAATSHTSVTVDLTGQGGVLITGDGTWGSSVHYVAIRTQAPAWMMVGGAYGTGAVPDAPFYTEVGSIYAVLDKLLPSWVTYDWFMDLNAMGLSGAASPGFFLDDEHNLDNERFAS